MDNYKVYVHINKINNKKYVGITKQECEERWRHDGFGYKSQIKFFRAIQKYGWDNFEHIVLYEGLTEEQASEKEKELIQLYDSYNNGYNADLGGSITNHSPETLEKMRQSMLGKKHTEETKRKISEAKENIKAKVICIETQKTYNSLVEAEKDTGIDRSSIGKCCKGIVFKAGGYTWRYTDPEKYNQYANITEHRVNRSERPVICITTNKYYATISEAARETNCDPSNIIKVCKGKHKTANNLKWRYADE